MKAVRISLSLDVTDRDNLIRTDLKRSGFASITANVLADGKASDPLVVVDGVTPG